MVLVVGIVTAVMMVVGIVFLMEVEVVITALIAAMAVVVAFVVLASEMQESVKVKRLERSVCYISVASQPSRDQKIHGAPQI